MSVAIKVSATLAEDARAAAQDADRSLTGQVEHWARLGKAVEHHFSASAIAFLKKNNGLLAPEEEQKAITQTLAALEKLRTVPHNETMRQTLFQQGPVFQADPNDSEGVIQVHLDGTKIAGKIVNREFVPHV
jgi:ParD-like antitoxin of type II bacterial toxin-antitoxin system